MEVQPGQAQTPLFRRQKMIGKFLAKFFRDSGIGRSVSSSQKMIRRLRSNLSKHGVCWWSPAFFPDTPVLAMAPALRGLAWNCRTWGIRPPFLGKPSPTGPIASTALPPARIRFRSCRRRYLAVGTPTLGTAGGNIVNAEEMQVNLVAGANATDYNFAILGAQAKEISLRMFMASAGSPTQYLTSLHAQPSVEAGDTGTSTYSTSYATGGAGVAVVSPDATINSPDSPTLASMTATIEDPEGSNEQLSADTAGTTLTSNYANGVLTVAGVAAVADYQTVLRTITYSTCSARRQSHDLHRRQRRHDHQPGGHGNHQRRTRR